MQMIALAIYDLFLSFSTELGAIWKRKFGTGTVLYLLIRYGTIPNFTFQVLNNIFVPSTLLVSVEAYSRTLILNLRLGVSRKLTFERDI